MVAINRFPARAEISRAGINLENVFFTKIKPYSTG